jgi:hypothetical protein
MGETAPSAGGSRLVGIAFVGGILTAGAMALATNFARLPPAWLSEWDRQMRARFSGVIATEGAGPCTETS